jgi:hypothetical protein
MVVARAAAGPEERMRAQFCFFASNAVGSESFLRSMQAEAACQTFAATDSPHVNERTAGTPEDTNSGHIAVSITLEGPEHLHFGRI